jgi:hypothetical protein
VIWLGSASKRRDHLSPFRDRSSRIVEYSLQYFFHLRETRLTFLHVMPPASPGDWSDTHARGNLKEGEVDAARTEWTTRCDTLVEDVAAEGKEHLLKAGVAAQNIAFKVPPTTNDMAHDILVDLGWETTGCSYRSIRRKGYPQVRAWQHRRHAPRECQRSHGVLGELIASRPLS